MKKQLGPSDAIFPVPAALIVSGMNEDANIILIFQKLILSFIAQKFANTGL